MDSIWNLWNYVEYVESTWNLWGSVKYTAQMLLILAFYFRNYYINCTLVELKASNFIRDIGMVRLPTVAIYDFA